MKKFKVLYMVSSLVKQGPNIVLRNLLQAINTDLFEVHVLTFKQEKDNSLIEEITRNEKIKLHFCQYERLGSVSSINSIIEMINPDIVPLSAKYTVIPKPKIKSIIALYPKAVRNILSFKE